MRKLLKADTNLNIFAKASTVGDAKYDERVGGWRVDTTGDGKADSFAFDTTGDGHIEAFARAWTRRATGRSIPS